MLNKTFSFLYSFKKIYLHITEFLIKAKAYINLYIWRVCVLPTVFLLFQPRLDFIRSGRQYVLFSLLAAFNQRHFISQPPPHKPTHFRFYFLPHSLCQMHFLSTVTPLINRPLWPTYHAQFIAVNIIFSSNKKNKSPIFLHHLCIHFFLSLFYYFNKYTCIWVTYMYEK